MEALTETLPDSTSLSSAEDFGNRLMAAFNDAALVLMVSVGHRTGLFDAMEGAGGLTSAELAARSGLNERYVREWLGAMTTGRVVEHDPMTRRYELPAHRAAWLTRAAAPNNLAALAQYVPLLGSVEDAVVRCFREGGGVPYSAFPRFQEVMAEDSGQSVLPVLIDMILPLVPGLPARLEAGIDVLDVGCGRGKALMILAERFPRSRFLGVDLDAEAMRTANAEAAAAGLRNLRFEARDATSLGEPASRDLVTAFDAIHDQADPAGVLRAIASVVRPDGWFLMQDIKASSLVHENVDHPIGTFLYTVSCMHCMTVSLAAGGAGLGTCWGTDTALRMLAEAGFTDVTRTDLPHDIQNTYYACRR